MSKQDSRAMIKLKRYFTTVPALIRYLSPGGLVWEMPQTTQPTIYLTFDDGPVPDVTPAVLSILRDFNAKATFFCVGDNVKKYPEIYEQVLAGGHATANHTFSHLKGTLTDNSEYFSDVDKCSSLVHSKLFRPPYGRIKYSQAKMLKTKYKIIMWTVLSGDYNQQIPKEEVLRNVLKHTRDGSIIVFHDSLKASGSMLYALPETLKYFSDRGYIFKSIQ